MPGYSSQPPPVWPPQPPAPPSPRKSRAVPILVGALVVLVAAVAALSYILVGKPGTTRTATLVASPSAAIFDQARGDCKMAAGYNIGDAGRTLDITVSAAFMTDDELTCLVGELHMPDAVMQHVMSTRALDGQQTDSWPGYTARWTYHPDDGLQMTIREA